MPKIFTDQHTHAPKPCIERADRIAPGKEATFIKQAISRQIYFMMNVHNRSPGKVGGSNVKAMTRVLVHEANHQVQITTRLEKMLEDRVILRRLVSHGCDQIL